MNIVLSFSYVYLMFHIMLKTRIMLLLNVFDVILVVSTLLINYVNYLSQMVLFIKLLLQIVITKWGY